MTPDPVLAALREVRLADGWTQQDVATAIGMSRAQIANAESGRSSVPLSTLRRWCEALNVELAVAPRG